jgi:hypothetical protein
LGASDAQTDLGTFDFVDNLSVQGLLPKWERALHPATCLGN